MLRFGTVMVKLSKDCFQYDMVWYGIATVLDRLDETTTMHI